jgi:hypothetical protein
MGGQGSGRPADMVKRMTAQVPNKPIGTGIVLPNYSGIKDEVRKTTTDETGYLKLNQTTPQTIILSEAGAKVEFGSLDFGGNDIPLLIGTQSNEDTALGIPALLTNYVVFINPDTGSTNIMTITDAGLLTVGGIDAFSEEIDAFTGIKEVITASGKFFGSVAVNDKAGIIFKNGAGTGLGAVKKLGAVTSIVEEQGANWKGGLVFDVFAEPTGETPQTAMQIKSNKDVEFKGKIKIGNTELTEQNLIDLLALL